MPAKNYRYSRCHNKNSLEVIKTPQMLARIQAIDERHLQDALTGQERLKGDRQGWKGKCPFCSSWRTQKRQKYESYKPAYLTVGRNEGCVFHCCACGTTLTTYKFLAQSQGVEVAERYSQERWDAGQLCGGGWNCPLPQSVRRELDEAKEERKKKYKEEYEKKRRENYERKYNSFK
jgi:hypothetical protein